MFDPPRWLLRMLWNPHRAGHAISGGRLGLRIPASEGLGALAVTDAADA